METKTDINVLLEGIRCQQDDIPSLKQALLTLASMCTSNDEAQNYLRECGGLVLVSQQLTTTTYTDVKEAALYTLACAVDKNVYSQKQLTSSGLFNFLYPVIKSGESTYKLKQTACFLLLNLVANNGHGQMLLRKSNCLALLFDLFKNTLPNNTRSLESPTEVDWFDNITPKQRIDLWTTVTSVLCVAVNNPQNDENQRLCSGIFPYAFVLMESHPVLEIVRPLTSLIGLAVANNVHNQQRVLRCSGLDAMVNCLHRAVNRLKDGKTHLQLAICLTNTLDTVIADNEMAAAKCGDLGVISLLLKEIMNECMDEDLKRSAVITLGHCVDLCASNQKELVDLGGIPFLIRSLGTGDETEEFNQAVKFVLQACTSKDAFSSKITLLGRELQQTGTNPRTEMEILENKFEELESRLALQGPSRGATLQELASCRMPDEVSEAQTCDSLRSQLEKEKALRQKFELEAKCARRELNKKLNDNVSSMQAPVMEHNICVTMVKNSAPSETFASCRGKNESEYDLSDTDTLDSASQIKPPPASKTRTIKCQQENVEFLKPFGPVPKTTADTGNLKTLRNNRYTPRRRIMKLHNSRCNSPSVSMMSEFDARLLKSAVTEVLDISSDVSSADNVTVAESDVIMTDGLSPDFSKPVIRDSGGGDATRSNRCPGCQPPIQIRGNLLTSRNYNIVLETDCYTCEEHRYYRLQERKLMGPILQDYRKDETSRRLIYNGTKPDSPTGRDVYSIPSSEQNITPQTSSSSDKISLMTTKSGKSRRVKILFTDEEEENLRHGVRKMGYFWAQILNTYSFHPSRTSVDLKDKYRNMKHTKSPVMKRRREIQPFSMAEERRLKRGVKQFGNNWSAILKNYKFQRGRTSVDLKDKWRNVTKSRSQEKQ